MQSTKRQENKLDYTTRKNFLNIYFLDTRKKNIFLIIFYCFNISRGCTVGTPSSKTQNEKDAVKLWEESTKLVKLTAEENPFPAEYLSRKEKRDEKENNRNLRLKTQI